MKCGPIAQEGGLCRMRTFGKMVFREVGSKCPGNFKLFRRETDRQTDSNRQTDTCVYGL